MTEDRLAELMVRVVDETATPLEREELMAHLASRPELRAELDSHRALKAVTDGWVARLDRDLAQDRYAARAPVRWVRSGGVALVLLGFGILLGWGLVELAVDPTAPLWVKAGVGALSAGTLALLGSLVMQRLATSDPYSEVIR
ncbi:MAG: anti-sigma factor RsiW [Myxococcota bacterium]|jgi:anti-sigma factor RsiW